MHCFIVFPIFLIYDEHLIFYSEIPIDDPQKFCVQMELAFTDKCWILYIVDKKNYMPC